MWVLRCLSSCGSALRCDGPAKWITPVCAECLTSRHSNTQSVAVGVYAPGFAQLCLCGCVGAVCFLFFSGCGSGMPHESRLSAQSDDAPRQQLWSVAVLGRPFGFAQMGICVPSLSDCGLALRDQPHLPAQSVKAP